MFSSHPAVIEGLLEGNPCSTLYITNIDPKVKEQSLAAVFERYGPIRTVKIVRDKVSGKSLSYGFVEFFSPQNAEEARIKAQYQRIERREILVMFTLERQKLVQEAKIFVKNISPSVTVNELHEHFAKISPNLFVHINTDDKGKRLNFGFVHFINIEDTETAFTKLQDSQLKGQKLQLSRWVVKEVRQVNQIETRRNLYIRNLPLFKKKVIENSLRQILSPHGEIESMLIKKAPKLNTYYALASFRDPQAAQNALKELTANPVTLENSNEPIYVSWYQRKTERKSQDSQQLNALYLSNLKADVEEQEVREVFMSYGDVIQVILTPWEGIDNEGDAKCAYIIFENETSAEYALAESQLNNNLKALFSFEPELELTSYRSNTGTQNRLKHVNRTNLDTRSPKLNGGEQYMYWPATNPYMGNMYTNMYPPYFQMGYYPPQMYMQPGFMPFYPNNMFYMPQENIMEQNNYLYLPNDSPSRENNNDKKVKKTVSTTTTSSEETRPNSLESLDGENSEEAGNTEYLTSSEELDSLELNPKRQREISAKDTEKVQSEKSKENNQSLSDVTCKPKRKYGNLKFQKQPLLP